MKWNWLKLWPVLVVALSILGPQRGSAYYDPQVQRWINRDPLGEAGGVNLYRFAGNQSLYYIDPFGLNLGIPGVSPGHGAMRTPQNIVPGNMIAPPGNTREQMHVALDGVGTLEPTPFADMFNAFLYALQGDWGNAGISAMGMIPYLGDAAKAGKYGSKACSAAERAAAENRAARNFFKNNKEKAREAWEQRTGQKWPTDANGNPWPAEHTPPLKSGGDPMTVTPRDPGLPDPHNIPGPDGLTDYQRWGALGTPAREANK